MGEVYQNILEGKYENRMPYERNSARAMREYDEEEKRLEDLFWADAFAELGISPNHPKAARFRQLCWDAGHSNGFREIWSVAQEWGDLLTVGE